MPSTIRLHRVLKSKPERVYRAFLDPDAIVKWMPPHGFTGKVHQMDVRVGGSYKMSFTNFTTGKSHSFGGEYLELLPKSGSDTPTSRLPESAGPDAGDHHVKGGLLRDRTKYHSGRGS